MATILWCAMIDDHGNYSGGHDNYDRIDHDGSDDHNDLDLNDFFIIYD